MSPRIELDHIDIHGLLHTARQAGDAIMNIYRQDFDVWRKEDGSPLTQADQCSHEIIHHYLSTHYSLPILSEESENVPYKERKNWSQFWMVDPLDGTKEFIHKRREFTVNIALIENQKPVLGVIYAPVFEEMYYAISGRGCFFQYKNHHLRISTSPTLDFQNKIITNPTNKHVKLILSRSHNDGFHLADYMQQDHYTIQSIAMGSSLKFCRVAEGNVDINIRMKPTMEWDTAAGQIILEEAGHKLVQYENEKPLMYNKENLVNPYFIAY